MENTTGEFSRAEPDNLNPPAMDTTLSTSSESPPDLRKLNISPTIAEPSSSTNEDLPPHRSHDPSKNLKRSDPFQFGSRYLLEDDDVFEFNAWDHVETDDDYKRYAESQYAKQREKPVSDFDKKRFNVDPARWWNLFYKNNTTNFFKDRKWLQQEFPVLAAVTQPDAPATTVVELGAGAGNTAFPILANNQNPRLRLFAYDFSRKAVELMRADARYDERLMRADVWDVAAVPPSVSASSEASTAIDVTLSNDDDDDNGDDDDETDPTIPPGLAPGSVDIVLLIFVFSALSPAQWRHAVRNIHRLLRPGGEVLLRDYARGDLVQVRFRKGRYMDENFYVRGDGTRVYFFDRDELAGIWSDFSHPWSRKRGADRGPLADADAQAGLDAAPDAGAVDRSGARSSDGAGSSSTGSSSAGRSSAGRSSTGSTSSAGRSSVEESHASSGGGGGGGSTDTINEHGAATGSPQTFPQEGKQQGFQVLKLDLDKRLLVNRQRKLKMYRCWIQGRFKKI